MQNNLYAEIIPDYARRKAKYAPVLEALQAVYGALDWDGGSDPMDELVSCILSQNTNDNNRDRAFAALQLRYKNWQAVADAPTDELIDTLRPAGLANQKAPRIQKVLHRIREEVGAYNIEFLRDLPLDEARAWLMSFDGIGPKTAAIVLCFAFGRPAFPVDTHIYRVGQRIGFIPPTFNVERAHPLMESIVPPDMHYAFHIYLIRHGRDTCKAQRPRCESCPLQAVCDYYQDVVRAK